MHMSLMELQSSAIVNNTEQSLPLDNTLKAISLNLFIALLDYPHQLSHSFYTFAKNTTS